MTIIDGKKTAEDLRLSLKNEVDNLKKKFNKVPGLTVILIGEYAPSKIYVRNKEKSAIEIGLKSEIVKYPDTVDEKTVLAKINELNKDENVSGTLLNFFFKLSTSFFKLNLKSSAVFFPSIIVILN